MDHDTFDERRQALEDLFFKNQDQELIERYRAEQEADAQRAALAQASGINNAEVLDHLIEVGINAQTLAALTLVPLVEVAWADQAIEQSERDAIQEAAAEAGIEKGSPSSDLLAKWMKRRPGPALIQSWSEYVHELKVSLGDERAAALKAEIVAKSRQIAEAAGGFWGINKVDDEEADTLERIAAAFD